MARPIRFSPLAPSKALTIGSGVANGVNNALQNFARMRMQQMQMQQMGAYRQAQAQFMQARSQSMAQRYGDQEMPSAFLASILGDHENPAIAGIGKKAGQAVADAVINAPTPQHGMIAAKKFASMVGPSQTPAQPEQPSQPQPNNYGFQTGPNGGAMVPYGARSLLSNAIAMKGKLGAAETAANASVTGHAMDYDAKIKKFENDAQMASTKQEHDLAMQGLKLASEEKQKAISGQWAVKAAAVRGTGAAAITANAKGQRVDPNDPDQLQLKGLLNQQKATLTEMGKPAMNAMGQMMDPQAAAQLHAQRAQAYGSVSAQIDALKQKIQNKGAPGGPAASVPGQSQTPFTGGAGPIPNPAPTGGAQGKAPIAWDQRASAGVGDSIMHPSGKTYVKAVNPDGSSTYTAAGVLMPPSTQAPVQPAEGQ